MGKGTILQNLGEGRYRVELDYGKNIKDAKIQELTIQGTKVLGDINDKEDEYDTKEADVISLQQQINVLVQAYSEAAAIDPLSDSSKQLKTEIDGVLRQIVAENAQLASIKAQLDILKAGYQQIERQKGQLGAVGVLQEFNAWCVDYTTDATGEVATIEIPGENDAVVIQPGARVPTDADGFLRARGLMDPNQVYYNAAILPGWQRWMPTYRKATVLSVNKANDTANVQLDDARSSAQNLPVNFDLVLNNVPVVYMTCNARVFKPGDRVVVEFVDMDRANPRVIGFVDNPRSCFEFPAFFDIRVNIELATINAGLFITFAPLGPGSFREYSTGISGIPEQVYTFNITEYQCANAPVTVQVGVPMQVYFLTTFTPFGFTVVEYPSSTTNYPFYPQDYGTIVQDYSTFLSSTGVWPKTPIRDMVVYDAKFAFVNSQGYVRRYKINDFSYGRKDCPSLFTYKEYYSGLHTSEEITPTEFLTKALPTPETLTLKHNATEATQLYQRSTVFNSLVVRYTRVD
jgi:translation initiation factor IF-1